MNGTLHQLLYGQEREVPTVTHDECAQYTHKCLLLFTLAYGEKPFEIRQMERNWQPYLRTITHGKEKLPFYVKLYLGTIIFVPGHWWDYYGLVHLGLEKRREWDASILDAPPPFRFNDPERIFLQKRPKSRQEIWYKEHPRAVKKRKVHFVVFSSLDR